MSRRPVLCTKTKLDTNKLTTYVKLHICLYERRETLADKSFNTKHDLAPLVPMFKLRANQAANLKDEPAAEFYDMRANQIVHRKGRLSRESIMLNGWYLSSTVYLRYKHNTGSSLKAVI